MKKDKIKNNNTREEINTDEKLITRKQAIQRVGLKTLTAATMFLLMKTQAKASSSLPSKPPVW